MRYLQVLKETKVKTKKPKGVVLIDGSMLGPGRTVSEDLLLGGADAYDRYMAEKPCRVKKANK